MPSLFGASSVLAKGKNALEQLSTQLCCVLCLRLDSDFRAGATLASSSELLRHSSRDRFKLGHFACARDVYRRTIA